MHQTLVELAQLVGEALARRWARTQEAKRRGTKVKDVSAKRMAVQNSVGNARRRRRT